MQLLISGSQVLVKYLFPIGVYLLTCAGSGLLLLHIFPATGSLSNPRQLLISPVLGTIPLALLSFSFIQLSRIWDHAFILGSYLLAVIGLFLCILFALRLDLKKIAGRQWLIAIGCLVICTVYLILRLAYLKDLVLPPYLDSVEHYRIVVSFLDPSKTSGLFSGSYYHLGFHSLAAWLSMVTGLPPEKSIPLVGQLLLFLVPLSVFNLVLTALHRWQPALMAAIVSAFFWSMPEHAVNWGKYPTLAAVMVLPTVLAVILIIREAKISKFRLLQLGLAGLLFALGLVFLHSRMALCFLLILFSILLIEILFSKVSSYVQKGSSFALLCGLVLIVILNPSLMQLYGKPLVLFIIFIVFSLAGAWWYPQITAESALSALLVYLLIFLHVPESITRLSSTWMDIPFYQIFLFLPFSLIAGAGLGALFQQVRAKRWSEISAVVLFCALLIVLIGRQPYLPHECCNFVSRDDLNAIQWIKNDLPEDAQIAIPGRTDLFPVVGTDAGIWITALTGRKTIFLAYDTQWVGSKIHDNTCDLGVVYLYSSTMPESYDINAAARPEWYQVVFQSAGVRIFRVIGCNRR